MLFAHSPLYPPASITIEFSLREVMVGSFKLLAKSNGIINNYKTIQYTII
jgi:hypothetical protein